MEISLHFAFLILRYLEVKTNISFISGAHKSQSKCCYNAKPSSYHFYVKMKISVHFQICISVPLNMFDHLKKFSQRSSVSKYFLKVLGHFSTVFINNCSKSLDVFLLFLSITVRSPRNRVSVFLVEIEQVFVHREILAGCFSLKFMKNSQESNGDPYYRRWSLFWNISQW